MQKKQLQQQNYPSPLSDLTTLRKGLKDKRVLILDLDETLIHSRAESFEAATFSMPSSTSVRTRYFCQRPGLERFLLEVSKHYTLILFSSALKEYISAVLRALNIEGFFYLILDRAFCKSKNESTFIKDISILGLSPKDVIFIDDTIDNGSAQPQNTLIITPFKGDRKDRELSIIAKFLIKSAECEDIRSVIASLDLYLKNNKPTIGVQAVKLNNTKTMLGSKLDILDKKLVSIFSTGSTFGSVDEKELEQKTPNAKLSFLKKGDSEEICPEEDGIESFSTKVANKLVQILPTMNPKSQLTKFRVSCR